MKLAQNEFIAIKVTNQWTPNFYYGGGTGELRSAKIYKTLKKAKEAQADAKRCYGHESKLVILTITEKDFVETE